MHNHSCSLYYLDMKRFAIQHIKQCIWKIKLTPTNGRKDCKWVRNVHCLVDSWILSNSLTSNVEMHAAWQSFSLIELTDEVYNQIRQGKTNSGPNICFGFSQDFDIKMLFYSYRYSNRTEQAYVELYFTSNVNYTQKHRCINILNANSAFSFEICRWKSSSLSAE